MKASIVAIATAVVLVVVAGAWLWLAPADRYDWRLPEGFPRPPVPEDNPMSRTKVDLGRRLFYDRRLSVNGTVACATCHQQALAFTDGRRRSVGATGEVHPRNAMTLVNSAYATRLTWANHLLDRLEVQALTPMFGEQPIEMGLGGREAELLALLLDDPEYRVSFPRAFPRDRDPYSVLNVVRAIASFVRSIVSGDSPYDRFLRGDATALTVSQQRGLELFFSERLECFHCHGGFNLTDSSTHESAVVESVGFHNTGLYNVGDSGDYPPDNTGLYDLTGERRDMGRFKAPTLRNVELTAPYMHDGSIATLSGVIDHYAAGGRTITEGPYAGAGSRNPYKSPFLKGFELSGTERADLLAFLQALTDQSVISDAAFADPFEQAK